MENLKILNPALQVREMLLNALLSQMEAAVVAFRTNTKTARSARPPNPSAH